jgi:RNA polymerase sigma-70 factor (ECF subfamily)
MPEGDGLASPAEVPWLQPYPDHLLAAAAPPEDEPEAVVVTKETIELAFLIAIQYLPPAQRAVLILRDVLGWPAREVADLLGDSVNSVNSALQRARAGMREHLPAERQEWTGAEDDADNRELVRRFTEASVAADLDTISTMLRDDVRFSMPPTQGLIVGRDAVIADWVEGGYPEMAGLRSVATSVNRQPAVGYYIWNEHADAYVPITVDVLRISGGQVTEVTIFDRDQFPRLGLPESLPADGAR